MSRQSATHPSQMSAPPTLPRSRSALVCAARHDLRNPLSDILGFSEIICEEAPALGLGELADDFNQIRSEANHLLRELNSKLGVDVASHQAFEEHCRELETTLFAGAQAMTALLDASQKRASVAQNQAALQDDIHRVRLAARRLAALAPTLIASVLSSEQSPEIGAEADSEAPPTPPRTLAPDRNLAASLEASLSGRPKRHLGAVLVVEDDESNRQLLTRRLERQGYEVKVAENGSAGLERMRREPFDVVLLDIMMPVLDGHGVLEEMKRDAILRHVPVIMISALDDLKSLVRCIEQGADDYLTKPFDPVLLGARIGACLEKKRLRDQEQVHLQQLEMYLKEIQVEREKSDKLLLSVLPQPIAERLKQGENVIVDSFSEVTVLFADLEGFTLLSSMAPPRKVVHLLNEIFSAFDLLAARRGLEKIKTIGDAYMAVAGLPNPRHNHAEAAALLALDMQNEIERFNQAYGTNLRMRIGIHSGPVIAGIIGRHKFAYDLWGDTVNVASRMESHGLPGSIQVTEATYQALRKKFELKARGDLEIKGKGNMATYLLMGQTR